MLAVFTILSRQLSVARLVIIMPSQLEPRQRRIIDRASGCPTTQSPLVEPARRRPPDCFASGLTRAGTKHMGELYHECGVAAVHHAAEGSISRLAPNPGNRNSAARLVPRMLLDMQNRGQLAAGMASFRPDRSALIKTH